MVRARAGARRRMIQPLKNDPSVWSLCWVDLPEPLPVENDFFLPTVLLLVGPRFEPLVAPEIVDELDQIAAEDWLSRQLDEIGPPDQLLVWKAPEWVAEDWKYFGRDWKMKVKLVVPPRHEAKLQEQIGGSPPPRVLETPSSEVSAGLLRGIRRLRSPRKRRATVEKAIDLDPANHEAKIELADMEMSSGHYARALEIFSAVDEELSPVFRRRTPRWWEDPATRPFLRALSGTMLCQWHLGRAPEAADTAQRLLQHDKDDHMGARFYLPLFLLLAGELESASAYFRHYAKHYPDDMPNAWLSFAWGLVLCLEGDDQGARRKYREGLFTNIYIAPRLLGERPPPEDIYHPTERDEPQSAAEFAGAFGGLWEREAAAVRILRDACAEASPALDALIERRTRMADFMNQHYDPDYRAKWNKLLDEDEKLVKEQLGKD
ncbi:MAG: tetratricopeptide repeat protein [Chthoniobacterales bacterium]|jgi:tetratricopeptide (TPR) repeat protein